MLMAQEPYRRHDQAGVAEARDLLLKAVALDPMLARAWDFLANCYMQDAINGWSDRETAWERYREATRRAAALDPADAHIQLSLGTMYFERGTSRSGPPLGSGRSTLDQMTRWSTARSGRSFPSPSASSARRKASAGGAGALRTRPVAPAVLLAEPGYALYFASRYNEAVDALRKVPDRWLEPSVMLTLALAEADELADARAEAAEVLRLDPAFRPRPGSPMISTNRAAAQRGFRRGCFQSRPAGLHRQSRCHRCDRTPARVRGRPAGRATVTDRSGT